MLVSHLNTTPASLLIHRQEELRGTRKHFKSASNTAFTPLAACYLRVQFVHQCSRTLADTVSQVDFYCARLALQGLVYAHTSIQNANTFLLLSRLYLELLPICRSSLLKQHCISSQVGERLQCNTEKGSLYIADALPTDGRLVWKFK